MRRPSRAPSGWPTPHRSSTAEYGGNCGCAVARGRSSSSPTRFITRRPGTVDTEVLSLAQEVSFPEPDTGPWCGTFRVGAGQRDHVGVGVLGQPQESQIQRLADLEFGVSAAAAGIAALDESGTYSVSLFRTQTPPSRLVRPVQRVHRGVAHQT